MNKKNERVSTISNLEDNVVLVVVKLEFIDIFFPISIFEKRRQVFAVGHQCFGDPHLQRTRRKVSAVLHFLLFSFTSVALGPTATPSDSRGSCKSLQLSKIRSKRCQLSSEVGTGNERVMTVRISLTDHRPSPSTSKRRNCSLASNGFSKLIM